MTKRHPPRGPAARPVLHQHQGVLKVIPAEVGIIQTTFHNPATAGEPGRDVSRDRGQISFTSKGGFKISIDCTVEWEVLPEDMPALVAEYGGWQNVEMNVIDLQAHAIGRDKGIDYGVQDFLEGSKREKFQPEFTKELITICKKKNVTVHSAFIRNIDIPDNYMKQVRDKQIATETKLTNKVKEATKKSDSEVNQEEKMIEQKAKEVEYETKKLVAAIDVEVDNTQKITEAEIEKMQAEYQAKIAQIEADQKRCNQRRGDAGDSAEGDGGEIAVSVEDGRVPGRRRRFPALLVGRAAQSAAAAAAVPQRPRHVLDEHGQQGDESAAAGAGQRHDRRGEREEYRSQGQVRVCCRSRGPCRQDWNPADTPAPGGTDSDLNY